MIQTIQKSPLAGANGDGEASNGASHSYNCAGYHVRNSVCRPRGCSCPCARERVLFNAESRHPVTD
jgi:hypothetical protein